MGSAVVDFKSMVAGSNLDGGTVVLNKTLYPMLGSGLTQ